MKQIKEILHVIKDIIFSMSHLFFIYFFFFLQNINFRLFRSNSYIVFYAINVVNLWNISFNT